MKNTLIAFLFVLLPLFSYANPDMERKTAIIERIEFHKEQVLKELKRAENLNPYIPDLSKRQHMHALINGAIAAICIPEPRLKLLSVGLTIIGSLAVDRYDEFCEYREVLINASAHMEMVNFYNSLSSKMTRKVNKDRSTQYFMLAIDSLTMCDMLAFSIKNEEGYIFENFKKLRNYLMDEHKKSNWIVTENMSEKAWVLYENLPEILSECTDNDLFNKLHYTVRDMIINLEAAQRAYDREHPKERRTGIIFTG